MNPNSGHGVRHRSRWAFVSKSHLLRITTTIMSTKKTVSYSGGLMVLGSGAGLVCGVVTGNIAAGLLIGAALGLVFGACVNMNQQQEGRDQSE